MYLFVIFNITKRIYIYVNNQHHRIANYTHITSHEN